MFSLSKHMVIAPLQTSHWWIDNKLDKGLTSGDQDLHTTPTYEEIV